MMAAPTCPDGFTKDILMWRSESCPVSTAVYRVTAWTFVFGWIMVIIGGVVQLTAHCFASHSIPAWARRDWRLLLLVVMSAAMALPWGFHIATSRAGAADASTAERVCCACCVFLWLVVVTPIYVRNMMKMAIHHVYALNAARSRQMMRIADGSMAMMVLAYFGMGVAWACILFASTENAQHASFAVCVATCAITTFTVGFGLTALSVQLSALLKELAGSSLRSASAKLLREQVALLKTVAKPAIFCGIACIPCAVVPAIRAVGGVVGLWLFVCVLVPPQVLMLVFYARRICAYNGTAKVHATSADSGDAFTRFGRHSVAAITSAATDELTVDPIAHEEVVQQERQGARAAIAKNGISLRFMRHFADEFDIDDSVTAGDVCARHVKPITFRALTPLVTLLQDGRDGVGASWCDAPSQFISYAWSYPFRLLIDIVEQFEEENPPPSGTTYYYFLDQFSLNQHVFVDEQANQKELQQQIVASLEGQMTRAGHVLMCLHPWNKPVPLKRAWCLFELFVAMQSGCKVTMCFGRDDARALQAAVSNGNFSADLAVGEIDAAAAGATKSSDKELIMALIAEKVGVNAFNSQMQQYLKTAMKGTVTAVLSQHSTRSQSLQRRASRSSFLSRSHAAAGAGTGAGAGAGTADPGTLWVHGAGTGAGAAAAAGTVGQLTAHVNALGGQVNNVSEALGMQVNNLSGQVNGISEQFNALGGRMTAMESSLGGRLATIDGRMTAMESSLGGRMTTVDGRMTAIEEQLATLTRMMGSLLASN